MKQNEFYNKVLSVMIRNHHKRQEDGWGRKMAHYVYFLLKQNSIYMTKDDWIDFMFNIEIMLKKYMKWKKQKISEFFSELSTLTEYIQDSFLEQEK